MVVINILPHYHVIPSSITLLEKKSITLNKQIDIVEIVRDEFERVENERDKFNIFNNFVYNIFGYGLFWSDATPH